MISHTRPSHFSTCNIEKLGMGLGTKLCSTVYLYPLLSPPSSPLNCHEGALVVLCVYMLYESACRTTLSCLIRNLVIDWLWRESWKKCHISHYPMHVSIKMFTIIMCVSLKGYGMYWYMSRINFYSLINPQRMCEGYGGQSVYVCLSVTTLAATYLVLTSKIRCLRVLYGILQICNMWLLLRMLCSKFLASFADHCSLPHSLTSS